MSQPDAKAPDWLKGEASQSQPPSPAVNEKAALKQRAKKTVESSNDERPVRTLKGFRIREDYQVRFDVLVATIKHSEGKKGPDLMEEALELLFRKYDKKLTQ